MEAYREYREGQPPPGFLEDAAAILNITRRSRRGFTKTYSKKDLMLNHVVPTPLEVSYLSNDFTTYS